MTRRTRSVLVAVATVVLVVVATGAAFGFTDDSSAGGATFVTAANALKAAGCAAGFGDGSFGYNSNVTRGQDAIFQIACAPGSAYVNNSGAAAVTVGTSATTLASVTITAGINPGGLQFVQVFGEATLQGAGGGAILTPSITITPPAGGTAASPATITCRPVSIGAPPTNAIEVVCNGAATIPTGQSMTVALQATSSATSTVNPGTLNVITTPRGNTASSGKLA